MASITTIQKTRTEFISVFFYLILATATKPAVGWFTIQISNGLSLLQLSEYTNLAVTISHVFVIFEHFPVTDEMISVTQSEVGSGAVFRNHCCCGMFCCATWNSVTIARH